MGATCLAARRDRAFHFGRLAPVTLARVCDMNRELLRLVSLISLGLVIGVPSYITMTRHWPGMIAGFDPARCSDVARLTRGVGSMGLLIGSAFIVAGLATYALPQYRIAVTVGLAAIVIGGSAAALRICNRFTRR